MVHFVGAGCGAPDLITLRGRRLLEEADVIVYAGSLVNPALLGFAKKDCRIYNSAQMTLEEVIAVMEEAESRQQMTVRLHTGDPSLYGAIREQIDRLKEQKIAYDVTPGVSSFCGAAAALDAEYTLPGITQSVIITRMAGRTPVPEAESIASFAAHGCAMVIFLSAGMLEGLQRELLKGAYAEQTPAAIVYKASWPEERTLRCPLGNLARCGKEAGISQTALVMVGNFLGDVYDRSCLYDPAFTTKYRQGTQMSNHFICSSPSGATLGQRILAGEDVFAADWELTQCFGADHESLSDWTKRVFQPGNNLLFIGAAGIAVRAIAPYVREKQSDPAVVVMDEKANWCIPILSGHLGGANLLANKLAKMTGAQAAITTATDVRGVWAVDSWAKQEGLTVVNPSGIKEISAGLLQGQTKKLFSEFPISGKLPEGLVFSDAASCDIYIGIHRLTDRKQEPLYLIPAALIAGIGCRKGAQREQLDALFEEVLEQNNVWQQAVQKICSIDLKKEEPGLLLFCAEHGILLETYDAETLRNLDGEFTASAFVSQVTGVDNVCERSAMAGSQNGKILISKMAKNGVTAAFVLDEVKISF